MKKLALLSILLVFCRSSFKAQNNLNSFSPTSNTTFIHISDLPNFSQDELDVLHGNYIVFDGLLTEEVIQELIIVNKSTDSEPQQSLKPEEQQFVKEWLSQHPEVKIVTRKEYANSLENVRNEYLKSHCLILQGEIVTPEDILNY